MNYGRLVAAGVVAWIVDSVYGFLVFGLLLDRQFAQFPGVFRTFDEVNAMLPLMFGASFVAFQAIAYIFAKGHDGGAGLTEGVRFGLVLAVYGLFGISVPSYVIYRIGATLAIQS